jgi:hypothetical protein
VAVEPGLARVLDQLEDLCGPENLPARASFNERLKDYTP